MNIPDNILQAAIDAAFREQPDTHLLTWPDNAGSWTSQEAQRLYLFKRALTAIAPHLAPAGVGEYTDEELVNAYAQVMAAKPALEPVHLRLRAFLAALPRRESQGLAQAIARAENAEGILKKCMSAMPVGNINTHTVENLPGRISDLAGELATLTVENERLEAELSALRASHIGVLRPLAEAGPEPEGCVRVHGWFNAYNYCILGVEHHPHDTHFADIRLPEASKRKEVAK